MIQQLSSNLSDIQLFSLNKGKNIVLSDRYTGETMLQFVICNNAIKVLR